ncbi:MAG: hypothetical protein DME18_01640, partial [Verrucomicrobia bacterium]
SFTGTNGSNPWADLVLGSDGSFYGTTAGGGSSNLGTVFQITTNGMLTTLVSFTGTNGSGPNGLALGRDGNFYGTTAGGGVNDSGTVFRVTTNGLSTTLVSFTGTNGWRPKGLVLGGDGNFYGTTFGGYAGGFSTNLGTVFQLTTNGVLTTMVWFTGTNGAGPNGLVLGGDRNLYGTTFYGGAGDIGTIFRLVMPKFSSVARQPGGSLWLSGVGPANEAFRLWAGTDLSLPFTSWTQIASSAFDSSGTFSYTDAGAASNHSRFYRISVP